MKNIQVKGTRCEFEFHTTSHSANSLRRALLSDVKNIAPDCVTIRKNTSCQTDEFIAHRIGLIPFGLTGHATDVRTARLKVMGRTAMAHDIVSSAYKAYTDMPIMKLGPDQVLDLDITFRTGTGAEHARFSHIGAVRYRTEPTLTSMGFDVITDEPPLVYLSAALESLVQRLDGAISFIETEYDAEHASVLSS